MKICGSLNCPNQNPQSFENFQKNKKEEKEKMSNVVSG